MRSNTRSLLFALLLAPLAACHDDGKQAALPTPAEPTAATVAHFCDMAVLDHPGPKGQIFLKGGSEPIWFSSVRDAIAFTMLPEAPPDPVAIYVNDMARAKNWERPEPGTWVEARAAWFVLGSERRGGMGGKEPIAFSDEAAARSFGAAHGGRVLRLAQVPESEILGGDGDPGHAGSGGADGLPHSN